MRTSGEAATVIRADPTTIYEAVADVTRIGEFSPECHRARWLDDTVGTPVAGARFRGWNAAKWIRWSRECEVVVADPGHEFAFRTIPTWIKRDSTMWTYRFEAVEEGTKVVETYDITQLPPRPIVAMISRLLPHHLDMRPHMQRTLASLKTTLERQPASSAPGQ